MKKGVVIAGYFADKIQAIKAFNDLTFIMDYGESESVILFKELNADFLLIVAIVGVFNQRLSLFFQVAPQYKYS